MLVTLTPLAMLLWTGVSMIAGAYIAHRHHKK